MKHISLGEGTANPNYAYYCNPFQECSDEQRNGDPAKIFSEKILFNQEELYPCKYPVTDFRLMSLIFAFLFYRPPRL